MLRDSGDRIILLCDPDGDGAAKDRRVLLDGLNQPFGIAHRDGALYVANTDAVLRFPHPRGAARIEGRGERILALPAGGYNNHWTRNLLFSPDGSRLLVTIGSASTARPRNPVAPASARSTWTVRTSAPSPLACTTRSAWTSTPTPARCGRR